jgi:hypothetical protein
LYGNYRNDKGEYCSEPASYKLHKSKEIILVKEIARDYCQLADGTYVYAKDWVRYPDLSTLREKYEVDISAYS